MVTLDFKASAERWKRYEEEHLLEARSNYLQGINFSIQIATFLLGFNVLWFQVKPDPLSDLLKIFITLSLSSLIISLVMGIWSIIEMNSFMNNIGEYFGKMSEKLYEYMLDTGRDGGNNYPKYLLRDDSKKLETSIWQHNLQLFFLLVGVTMSLVVSLLLLWS